MKRHQIKILFGISVAWVIAVAGNGCGASFGTNELEGQVPLGDDLVVTEATTSHGIRTINQILPNMLAVTQYKSSVEDVQVRFDEHKNNLSVTGAPDSLTAPMMLAIGNIAYEVCDQLIIRQEQPSDPAERRYFSNVDFNSGIDQEADEMPWINQMARDFFGREVRESEVDLILSAARSAFPSGNAAQMKMKVNFVCGAMLGSLESNIIR
ncbi:MAG: hypothetical protein CL677_03815 [Bdellovibrionaceae bacterium]|nr:hypothetical protein [Pseudobdellovibrionaceae bacterium]|tara:strand:- start:30601 stop:31230 length:630 start_codon:yes stop_codon:yes gene_type:complete